MKRWSPIDFKLTGSETMKLWECGSIDFIEVLRDEQIIVICWVERCMNDQALLTECA